MNRLVIALAAFLGLALAGGASAQQVKGGENGLRGTIITGSCMVAPGADCTILSAPEKGTLVITTGCITQVYSSGHFGFVLNGQPLDSSCLANPGSGASASSLPVGYVVAAGDHLDCTDPPNSTVSIVCTASGVLTKK